MGAACVVGAASLRGALSRRQTRSRLFDLELDAAVAEVRQRLEETRMRKQRHDLVNAFTAVEGAATILGRETLTASDRSTLADVLGSGLGRLRGLLLAGPEVADHVSLGELTTSLADSLAEEAGWRDRFHVDVPPDLVVAGSPGEIGEAIRHLLIHASRRAPSRAVTVRAFRNGDRIELWVDDCGPPLSARERREIRQPGRRPCFGPDEVGGLHVAIRLARGQGGDVRVEARPAGGESFGVVWRAHDG